jgi:nitrate/nitrite transporter NarK
MRLVLVALILIVLASFYHVQLADLFYMSPDAESRIYRLGIFWAAAIGGYGVVLTALGCALSPSKNDGHIRLLPIFIGSAVMMFLFFYLLSATIEAPPGEQQRRLRPGETITI